jgi:hypothetical protein
MPLLKRRHRSWRGFADSLPLASRDDERPKKMKSHSQSSPMAKSILAVGALALLFAFPMLKKVSDTSIGRRCLLVQVFIQHHLMMQSL